MSFFPRTSAELNAAEVRPATSEQKVARLQERFKKALLNVATNRKEIYDIIQELKEHFHEYGFKSPAAAVESTCQRTKRWANAFCAEIEAELEIYGHVVGTNSPTSTDSTAKKEEAALKKVEAARDEKPPSGTATEPNPEPEPPQKLKDKTGVEIPDALIEMAERRKEVTGLEHHASALFSFFKKLQTDPDRLFRHIKATGNVQTFMNSANTIRYALSGCIPDVVCPVCRGTGDPAKNAREKNYCYECAGSGMISEVHWNRHWVKSNDSVKLAEVERRRNGTA